MNEASVVKTFDLDLLRISRKCVWVDKSSLVISQYGEAILGHYLQKH